MFKSLNVTRIPSSHKKLIIKKDKMEETGPKRGFLNDVYKFAAFLLWFIHNTFTRGWCRETDTGFILGTHLNRQDGFRHLLKCMCMYVLTWSRAHVCVWWFVLAQELKWNQATQFQCEIQSFLPLGVRAGEPFHEMKPEKKDYLGIQSCFTSSLNPLKCVCVLVLEPLPSFL